MFKEFEEFCDTCLLKSHTRVYLEGKPRNCRALASAYSRNQCNTVQSSARHELYTYIHSSAFNFQLSPRLTLCSECNKSAPAGSIVAASKSDSQRRQRADKSSFRRMTRLHSCWCYWAQFLGWTEKGGICWCNSVGGTWCEVFLASNCCLKNLWEKMWSFFVFSFSSYKR